MLSTGVFEQLTYNVLGSDLPILAELTAKLTLEARTSCASERFLAVTRSNSKQKNMLLQQQELPFANDKWSNSEHTRQVKKQKMQETGDKMESGEQE